MANWKFLRAGAVSPFTGYVWEPQKWVDAMSATTPGRVSPCLAGIHACRTADLPYWLNDELWQIDLGHPVVELDDKLVAPRARLVAQVEGWTPHCARELAVACVVRVAHHAECELRDRGMTAEAESIAAVSTEDALLEIAWSGEKPDSDPGSAPRSAPEVAVAARGCGDAAADQGARRAARLCGYVVDAIEALTVYPAASVAYIAARAANQRSSPNSADDPYRAERAWQANWLSKRLDLETTMH